MRWPVVILVSFLSQLACSVPTEGTGLTEARPTGSESESTSPSESGDATTTEPSGSDSDSTTEAPTTEAPTTEAPTTEDPTTEAPTTEDPTTEDPTTEDPTTEAPTTEEPLECPPQPGDSACQTCIKEVCCPEVMSCMGNMNCTCWVMCIRNGHPQPVCVQMCGTPSQEYLDLVLCRGMCDSCGP